MGNILFFVYIFSGITRCSAVSEVKFSAKILQDNSVLCVQTKDKPAKATILEKENLKLSTNYTNNNYFQCLGITNRYEFVQNLGFPRTRVIVTPKMSGLWVCTIYTNKDAEVQPHFRINMMKGRFTELQCFVDFHVRLLKTPQTVLVNNIAIRTERNDNTEEEFDYSAVYYYYNDDIVTVQCLPGTDAFNDIENPSPIEFKYDYVESLDDMFKEQLEDKRSKLFGFRTKLHARHDNSVMICKYHGKNDYTTVKVTFVLQTVPDNVGYITINRLIARPFQGNDGLNSEINYYSFNGENVDISCTGYRHGFRAADKEENCETGVTTLTLTTPFTYNCFLCEDKERIYNIKVTTNKLDSNFKESKRLNVDLPSDNVLIELFKYDGEVRDSWIYYEFAEGEQLELKCTDSKDKSANAVLKVIYNFNNNKLETSKQLTLTSRYDNNVFECVLRDEMDPGSPESPMAYKRIKVLFRKRPLMTTSTTSAPVQTDPNESSKPNVIVIIIVSLAMLVSGFGISIVCHTCVKNKKTLSDTQNTTSSNRLQSRPLPDVPMQTQPLDCYDYVYSSSNYEEIELDETRNENRSQQNTMYYWAHQFYSSRK